MVIEPLHDYVPAFKVRVDKVFSRPCSPMLKFNCYMDLIMELKMQVVTTGNLNLSSNDMKVIFALMNRAMRAL